MRAIITFIILSFFYVVGSTYVLWKQNLPLISPLDLIEQLSPLAPAFRTPGQKTVFGFLPYWNMKDSDELNVRSLTHLAYFALDLNDDGTIKKFERPGEREPGWSQLNNNAFTILSRQMKLLNKKLILTVTAMRPDQIESVLNNPDHRNTAIDAIIEVVLQKQFDGINIDFEYMGYPDKITRDNFSIFVKDLTTKCKLQNRSCEISLDVFADSAIKNRLYDLKVIGQIIDQLIVMAYDFYRPSSLVSGPVAPLRGKCQAGSSTNCLDYDVVTSIADITKLVSPGKVVLGVPFYGYEWQTVDTTFLSRTYPKTGSTATYKGIQAIFTDPDISSISATWSATTFTPYLSYTRDEKIYQIHYEDSNSLKLKIDFIHQAKLAGLAIWAIGYEIPYQQLWTTISESL